MFKTHNYLKLSTRQLQDDIIQEHLTKDTITIGIGEHGSLTQTGMFKARS